MQYEGYTIPKGSSIIVNICEYWLRYFCYCSLLNIRSGGILHDPEIYEDPEIFSPDRYILSDVGTKKQYEDDIGQRNDLTFGGGRVSCVYRLEHRLLTSL